MRSAMARCISITSIRNGPRSRLLVSRYSTVLLPIVEITNSMLNHIKDCIRNGTGRGSRGDGVGDGSQAIKLVSGNLKKFSLRWVWAWVSYAREVGQRIAVRKGNLLGKQISVVDDLPIQLMSFSSQLITRLVLLRKNLYTQR